MKIVHLLPSIDFGGTERIVLSLAHRQQAGGHEVIILVFTNNNGYPKLSEGLNIQHLPEISVLWKWNKTISSHLEDLENTLTNINPDILHSHAYWTELMLYSIPKFPNAKYLSHFHLFYPFYQKLSYFDLSFLGHSYLKNRLQTAYTEYNTRFIAVSGAIHQYYFKFLNKTLRKKIQVVPNGIVLTPFKYKPRLFRDEYYLLSVGRLNVDKNYRFLLEIAKHLKQEGFKFHWKIAGEGPLKKELIESVKQLALQDHVTFLGQVSDIYAVYSASDLLIHTSKKESFGLTFLEAMSVGLPSVSLRAEGNEEIITNDVEGCLLDSNTSVQDFSNAIIHTLNDQVKYESYRLHGIDKAKEYSFEQYEDKIMNLYIGH